MTRRAFWETRTGRVEWMIGRTRRRRAATVHQPRKRVIMRICPRWVTRSNGWSRSGNFRARLMVIQPAAETRSSAWIVARLSAYGHCIVWMDYWVLWFIYLCLCLLEGFVGGKNIKLLSLFCVFSRRCDSQMGQRKDPVYLAFCRAKTRLFCLGNFRTSLTCLTL